MRLALRQWGQTTTQVLRASAAALVLLMAWEGFVSTPYKDIAGIWTNGFGNTHDVGPNTPPVSREQAAVQLRHHADTYGNAVLASLKRVPSQGMFDSFLLLTYNIGTGAFKNSSTAKAFNAGDYYGACLYINRWNKATVNGELRIVRGLTNRRYDEYNLCVTGLPYTGYVPRRH